MIVEKFLKQVEEPRVRNRLAGVADRLVREPVDFVEVVLEVRGMTCESCVVSVKAAPERIGTVATSVSLQERRATAKIPSGVGPEEADRAVSETGFEAVVVEVN